MNFRFESENHKTFFVAVPVRIGYDLTQLATDLRALALTVSDQGDRTVMQKALSNMLVGGPTYTLRLRPPHCSAVRAVRDTDSAVTSAGLLFDDNLTTLVDVKKQVYQRMAYLG